MVQGQKGLILFVFIFYSLFLSAQGKRQYFWSDNWYVGARAGITNSMAENISGFTADLNPSFSFEVGKVFTKELQVRANLGYYRQTGEASDACKEMNSLVDHYNFSMLYLGTDLLIDVTSGFSDKPRKFNLLPTVGVGMIYTYDFSEDLKHWYIYPVNTSSAIHPVFRLGLTSHISIMKNLDLSVNGLWNITSDSYNGVKVEKGGTNSFFELSAGFVLRFKDTYDEYHYRESKGPKDDYWLMLRKHRKRWLKK